MVVKRDYSVSYGFKFGYYHVFLHLNSELLVGFEWKGKYYQYNCLLFGFSTTPRVFSIVIREFMMYRRSKGRTILPYFDDRIVFVAME